MKKLLLSLLVLALVAPAMAVVNFGVVNGTTPGTATITINTNGDVVRGVALVVTCTGGAKLVDLSYTANAEFNTFIDYFAVTGFGEVTGETPNQEGHPFSLTGAAPGVAAVNDTTFGVTMGVLDGLGAQGGFSSTTAVDLITINTGAGNVCVSLEADNRGGVVGDVALTTNLPVCQDITAGASFFNLTRAAGTGGTVANPGVTAEPAGQAAALVATPNATPYQWVFWKWTGDVASITDPAAASTTIMMDGDKTATANFTVRCQEYNLTKLCSNAGDNAANITDLNNLIGWVNANSSPGTFSVTMTGNPTAWNAVIGNPAGAAGPKYNLTKKQGSGDNAVNISDVNAMIGYLNNRGVGLSVNCNTCGC